MTYSLHFLPRKCSALLGIFASLTALTAAGIYSPAPVSAAPLDSASSPRAAGSAPRILFGDTLLTNTSDQYSPFRTPEGKIYIAAESLASLGITYIQDDSDNKVLLAAPNGSATTTLTARRKPGAERIKSSPLFIPAEEAIESLGGRTRWNPATNSFSIFSTLSDIQLIGGQLRVRSTFPVMPQQIFSQEKPGLVILDFPGTVIEGSPRTLNLSMPGLRQARIGQFNASTGRIVLEMTGKAQRFTVLGGKPATQIVMNPVMPAVVISNNNATGEVLSVSSATPAAPTKSVPSSNNPAARISDVSFRYVSSTQAQFIFKGDTSPNVRVTSSQGQYTFILSDTFLPDSAGNRISSASHPFFSNARLESTSASSSQIILDTTRPIVYTIKMLPKGGMILDLELPRNAGGRLAGKLIAVDAGHGGSDSGARGVNGAYEKNVTLAIATKLADILKDMGANVMMTRGNDSFIGVNERPRKANRAGADFFLSVHADSGSRNRTVNGSTVYFHMQVGSSRALAQSIADQFAVMGGIRTKGARSDGAQWGGRFASGYGVLRNADMVAVLIETGFMSNPGDVNKLVDPDMQQKIAAAIASGLKNYIEGN